ncbi:Hypothetical protein NTJ_06699 [Nesidiocoris tenuis]|uniref:Uncharacterized protein n=2 Tax=Nesidiocoris tenuis TaxID=355587 RepID=A0ABN7ANU0_9HEMI|nr:Hypothetical protein NTJ_06699 [Nesidiocoris tenuis]
MTRKLNGDRLCKTQRGNWRVHQSRENMRVEGERLAEKLNGIPYQRDAKETPRNQNRFNAYGQNPPKIRLLPEDNYYSNCDDYACQNSPGLRKSNITSTLHTISSEKCIRLTSSEGDDTAYDEDATSTLVEASNTFSSQRCHFCKWQDSDKTSSRGDEIKEMKLKNLCGELLIELCKVTTGSRKEKPKTFETLTPSSSSGKNTAPDLEYGDQLKEACSFISDKIFQCRDFEYVPTPSPAKTNNSENKKVKAITFRPLVCTKLSIPWRHRKPTCDQVRKMSVFYTASKHQQLDSSGTVSTSTQVDESIAALKTKPPSSHDKAVCVRTRQRRYVKKIQKEKLKKPGGFDDYYRKNVNRHKRKTSSTRKRHEKLMLSRNRKDKTKRIQKPQRSNNLSKKLADFFNSPSNDKGTKHYIRSFNPSTATDSKTKTESESVLPKQRRRKNTFTLPSSSLVIMASSNRKSCAKLKKTDRFAKDLEAISHELSIIDSHVKEHSRAQNSSLPIFNNCFKRTPRDMKADRQKFDVKCEDHQTKNKRDGLFSCLIPKAFNKTPDGKTAKHDKNVYSTPHKSKMAKTASLWNAGCE